MKKISNLPVELAHRLVDEFDNSDPASEQRYRYERSRESNNPDDCDTFFDSLKLTPDSELWRDVAAIYEPELDCTLKIVRIHRFEPQDYCSEHQDSAYPDWDAIIIRLNPGDSRLVVDNVSCREYVGKAFHLPKMIRHNVLRSNSDCVRYSLLAWCEPR